MRVRSHNRKMPTWILSIRHLRQAPCRLTPRTLSRSSLVNLALMEFRGRSTVRKQFMDCASEEAVAAADDNGGNDDDDAAEGVAGNVVIVGVVTADIVTAGVATRAFGVVAPVV